MSNKIIKINKRGKLIVIEGTDGSGKATQTKLLIKRLKEQGIKVRTIDFRIIQIFLEK